MSEPKSPPPPAASGPDDAGGMCDQLHAYVDGELSDADHAAFETHLASCAACDAELPRLLALLAALDSVRAAEPAASAPAGGARLVVIPGGLDARSGEPARPERTEDPRGTPVATRPARRRSWQLAVGAAGLVAIAAGLIVVLRPTDKPPVVAMISLGGALAPTRSLEARLGYLGTEPHRPFDVARGAERHERISLDRMAELERAHNWHGLAVAWVLNGDRERAEQAFAQAAASPEVDSDRAALELADGSPAALERALDDVNRSLAAAPNRGAARWNRALVLAGLGLALEAAREFDRVVALDEPGWAEEARTRAAGLRAQVAQRRTRWKQAFAAGVQLLADGTPVPADAMAVTGYLTIILYDAVRSAPSKPRVEALLPLAQTLDAAYRSDRLTSYVRRIAGADFAVRAPLARRYADVILRRDGADVDGLLARLDKPAAGAPGANDDIWLGAMVRAGRVADHLDAYRQRALASQDPWFAIIAEHETAKAELAHGKPAAAERRLKDALATARRERMAYRALQLQLELSSLHKLLRNLGEAEADAAAAYRDAGAAGEGLVEMNTLAELATITQDRYAHGLARAYVAELLARAQTTADTGPSPFEPANDCATRQHAFVSLANISLLTFDRDRARTEREQVPSCDANPATQNTLLLRAALVDAELYRAGHRDEDRLRGVASLAALRRATGMSAAQQTLLGYIEGDLAIEVDRAAGQRALRAAIAEADHHTDDKGSYIKIRAYSFALLALDAGRGGDFAGVIRVIAELLEIPAPARCAVAIAVDGQQAVVAFADARGELGGGYLTGAAALDVAHLVPPAAAAQLAACDRVAVLARAPVLGAGRLLPPTLAWSYALPGAAARPSAPAGSAPAARRLVVANPEPPADLKLPPLGPYPDVSDEPGAATTTVLRGGDATPTRVLQAMRDASVIEFHTHGLIANDVSEASYLVLTPEVDHQYTLTATDVAGVQLAGAPLVLLGACHAATSSRSLEGGIGLAEAFLRAGARAVIASPDAVPDLGAHAFFTAVRRRVEAGADPAIAVRDERVRRLATSHDDAWVSGVVVFE